MNTFNGILRPVSISEFYFGLLPHYNMAAAKKKKNQVLLASSTCRPNLLCFGFDLTQPQSSKLISRNGYGPNCVPLRPCINKKAILICSTDSRSDVFAAKDGKMN